MVNIQPIADAVVGFRSSVLLFTAVQLGIFGCIGKGKKSARLIGRELNLNIRSTEIALDGLVAIGFLKKGGGRYSNVPLGLFFLDPQSPNSLSNNLNYQCRLMKAWMDLPSALAAGKPRQDLLQLLKDARFVNDYIRGMKEIARGPADQIARHLAGLCGSSVLDVGGGHGIFLQSLLEKSPALKGTLMDLPKTIQVARPIFNKFSGRVSFIRGDYRKKSFGFGDFDLVLMSHITHDESESTVLSLFKKAYLALSPGGRLAVHDFIVDDSHTSPLFSALFSVHMLTYTNKGRVYSLSEYKKNLSMAGFGPVKAIPINEGATNESCLLITKKTEKFNHENIDHKK